jgi:putative transposase
MTGRRRGVLSIGARIGMDDAAWTVTGFSGGGVFLTDQHGRVITVDVATVCARGIFDAADGPDRPVLAAGLLAGTAPEAVDRARWWEGHILEVLTGRGADAEPNSAPRRDYDPGVRTLAQREAAKAAELTALGPRPVSARTVRRRRQRYQARGLAGLVDWRSDRSRPVGNRVDPRVVEATRRVIADTVESSTRTVSHLRWRVEQALAAGYGSGVVAMPSRSAFYRLFDLLACGTHATGSARTRRSQASQPAAPFGVFTPVRPGELVQIDSTPLDVMVLLEDGVPGRVELTGMIDVATRTVTAAVLRPTTRSVDASLLLARTVTPEPMRPGWSDALAMSRSVLPHRHMLTIDERVAHAAAKPVIIPEMIVCDQGKVFVSHNFRSSCRLLGIDFQPTLDGSPAQKPHIEKMMGSVGTLFAQYVSGYLGSSVERRGRKPEAEPLWSLMELQGLLDEWLLAAWQNRPHDGLRDPVTVGNTFTPNEKYASLVQAAGYVHLALSAQDYIELLPATWRAINHYGVKIRYRTYDDEALNPLRRQPSGVADKRNLWEVHYDPYDVSRIWVRDHLDGTGWITLLWRHLSSAPMPFGELAWDHELARMRAQGDNPTEAEIAGAVSALLGRAHRGPGDGGSAVGKPSKRDRRVAARTRAAGSALPDQVPASPACPNELAGTEPHDDGGVAVGDVVPLEIFDARKEAERWW